MQTPSLPRRQLRTHSFRERGTLGVVQRVQLQSEGMSSLAPLALAHDGVTLALEHERRPVEGRDGNSEVLACDFRPPSPNAGAADGDELVRVAAQMALATHHAATRSTHSTSQLFDPIRPAADDATQHVRQSDRVRAVARGRLAG